MIYMVSRDERGARKLALDMGIPQGKWRHIGRPEQMHGLRGVRYVIVNYGGFPVDMREHMEELIRALDWKEVWE